MTRDEFIQLIRDRFPDNIRREISESRLREVTEQMANLCYDSVDIASSSAGGFIPDPIAPASSAPIVTNGFWAITTPGTYNNFGNVILPENHFGFIYKNGNSFSIQSVKMPMQDLTLIEKKINDNETKIDDFIENYKPLVSEVFDESDNEVAAGMQATAEYLGTKPTSINLGINAVGDLTTAMGGGLVETYISNTLCTATNDVIINSVSTYFSTRGNFKVAVTDESNNIIFTSVEYTAGTGWVTTMLPNINLKKSQTIWIVNLPTSTAFINFKESGVANNKFIQRGATGAIVTGPNTSYYSIYFGGLSDYPTGKLANYISRAEADGYTNIDPLETFASAVVNTTIGNQNRIAYYILKIPFTVPKTIQKINLVSSTTGNMTLVIGEFDQANKFIERSSFTVAVENGLNKINVDRELKVGQYIGIKTPGLMPDINTSLAHLYTWGVEGNYNSPLTVLTSWSLGMSIEVRTRKYNDNALAHMGDINTLNDKIENLQVSNIWKSPDGTNWRVGVNNSGQFTAQAVGRYIKILHFGNSILLHSITSYWWGLWGMAAKTREDDYAHRFLAKIKVANPTAQSWEQNIAEWEANPTGYNKANLDTILSAQSYDLIIVRLGENATATPASTYKTAFKDLINYIQNKVPTARIIIGGMFWVNGGLENAMIDIAMEKGLTYASMEGLDIPANKSFIGDVVQGDDGQSHTVDNAGVANHPNNAGMEAIATRLFTAANS